MASAKSVIKELWSTKIVHMVKLCCYRNGNGRTKPGEFLIGSSIKGLLEQATSRLELRGAGRRLYTEDGTLILDVQNLIDWTIDYYRNIIRSPEESKIEAKPEIVKPKARDTLQKNQKWSSLLDKVELSDLPPGSNRETILPESAIIKEEDFESGLNKNALIRPKRGELKRLIGEIDRGARVDSNKLFKWPIEVWVSCGEAFVSPNLVSKIEHERIALKESMNSVELELAKQTHVLRQMTGRRLTGMSPGAYKPIKNPDYPVVREGHWTEVTYEEKVKQMEVKNLKNYVDDLKKTNQPPTKNATEVKKEENNRFGNYSVTVIRKASFDLNIKKKVRLYVNGQSPESAQLCWASSIEELSESAKVKFRLSKPIKFFYTEDGKIISRFEDISRDQLICISTGREFIPANQRNKEVEIKANWSRVRRAEGYKAVDLTITSKRNPIVDVDPFGPPILTSDPTDKKQLALPAPSDNLNETNKSKKISLSPASRQTNRTDQSKKFKNVSFNDLVNRSDYSDEELSQYENSDQT